MFYITRILALEKHGGAKSLAEVFQAVQGKSEHVRVAAAMKHLLAQTAVVPLTDGHKMMLRQFGFSSSLFWGPVKVFMTNNFADTYSPIVAKLGGCGNVDVFRDSPTMPTAQRMHELVAKIPSLQARLFLLLVDS